MRKYSKEQKAYIEAKKALDILESQEKKMEADFVKSLGIVNEDGSVPVATWAIDDDEAADKAIEDFGKLGETDPLFKKLDEACGRNRELWNAEAEKILFEHFGVEV